MFTVNKNPTIAEVRKFGWVMLIGFGVIAAVLWLWPWFESRNLAAVSWVASTRQIIAICLLAVGLLLWGLSQWATQIARAVYVAWMSITMPVGIVMSTVLLTLLFLILLPAFSLIVRMGDPLRKRFRAEGTYWEDHKPHEATLDRMARPF